MRRVGTGWATPTISVERSGTCKYAKIQNGTATTEFRVRCFQPLSHLSGRRRRGRLVVTPAYKAWARYGAKPAEAVAPSAARPVFAADEPLVAEPVDLFEQKGIFSSSPSGSLRLGTLAIWIWPMSGIRRRNAVVTSPCRICR